MTNEFSKWPPPRDIHKNKDWWNDFWMTENGFGSPAASLLSLIKPHQESVAENQSAIDIGSGDGRYAIVLAQMGFATTAVELSTAGIEKIRERSEAGNVVVECKQLDFLARSVELGTFDLVVSSGLLEEIPMASHDLAIRRFVACCLPKGKIVIRYCIEIEGRGLLVEPDTIADKVQSLGCCVDYFEELKEYKTSRAGFRLKHGTLSATKR